MGCFCWYLVVVFVWLCLTLWFSLDEERENGLLTFCLLDTCMFILSVFICVFSSSCLYSFLAITFQFDELVKASNTESMANYIRLLMWWSIRKYSRCLRNLKIAKFLYFWQTAKYLTCYIHDWTQINTVLLSCKRSRWPYFFIHNKVVNLTHFGIVNYFQHKSSVCISFFMYTSESR